MDVAKVIYGLGSLYGTPIVVISQNIVVFNVLAPLRGSLMLPCSGELLLSRWAVLEHKSSLILCTHVLV